MTHTSPSPGDTFVSLLPQDGDLLIARRHATVQHDVLIVPSGKVLAQARYDMALAAGREAAQQLGVDLWVTEDHKHFRKLAAYRRARPRSE